MIQHPNYYRTQQQQQSKQQPQNSNNYNNNNDNNNCYSVTSLVSSGSATSTSSSTLTTATAVRNNSTSVVEIPLTSTANTTTNTTNATRNNQHKHIQLFDKITPNNVCWSLVGKHLRSLYGRLCYTFCISCCCCCPEKMLLPLSSSPVFSTTTTTTTTNNGQTTKQIQPTLRDNNNNNYYLCCCCQVTICRRRLPAWLMVSTVWTIALVLAYPHSLYVQLIHYDFSKSLKMTRCTINKYPDHDTRLALTWYTTITQYIFPIGLTTYFYMHIGVFLWRRVTVGAVTESKKILLLERKRNRVRMLSFVVFVFALCWLPLTLYNICTDHGYITHHQGK